VVGLRSSSLAIRRIEAPLRHMASILAIFRGSCSVRGRAPTRPWALARLNPAIVLSFLQDSVLVRVGSPYLFTMAVRVVAYGFWWNTWIARSFAV
jgi:hypothetical protein